MEQISLTHLLASAFQKSSSTSIWPALFSLPTTLFLRCPTSTWYPLPGLRHRESLCSATLSSPTLSLWALQQNLLMYLVVSWDISPGPSASCNLSLSTSLALDFVPSPCLSPPRLHKCGDRTPQCILICVSVEPGVSGKELGAWMVSASLLFVSFGWLCSPS